ncbi:FAD-binding oxidoreductase [Candidatus Pelagibacter ubique]|jgi:D-amino-acid dehydrogenase|nr:FAD-dependent oxidoreductase [Candidatus Pelagibacter bacterium]MDA7446077.1 FAD-binding oxidoreductase [Candidatus Pelagibacter ubique]MDA9076537.1 FAD-binding oxidoreductase [bacterium]MDA7465358.1 FAD-binding oxidoreductase [Candidatus Pelagibacter ubique]MDA7477071.1 FAD-binding oxidoreductase [Candidatus Pelagibacter ubique]MDA7480591.1 FAD-binding oxidoreductase [Candidatus Pelagibacter ubique]
MEKNLKIGIVGAGIQGISNALFLQKKGFSVTIFDRDEPGSPAASYGNAGHFSPYASVPINRPDVLTDVPAMLLSSTGPLALKWNYVPKMMPWFLQFIRNCTTKRMMHTAKNMHQILDLALPAYDELFDEVELGGLVEKKGILYIWNDQSLKSRELEIKVRNELGVDQQVITPKEIHDLEPNIKPIYHGGVYYQYGRHARNPKKILLKLYDLFLKKGGKFLKMNIKDINFNDEKPVIKAETQSFLFDKIVIACGSFSKKLTDNLDEKIPLDTERGYHVHFKNCDHLLSRPVIFQNRGFGITPMEQGLRVVGTVEFGGLDNPLSKSRVKNLINNAKYMMGDLPEHEDEWLGFRPTLPDYLPVIGPSKKYKNVFYCFGHHHLGWTLGPISGKIISGMIAEENTNLDLKPYSSLRFN